MRAMVPFAPVAAVFAITLLVSAGLCQAGLMDAGTRFWMGTVFGGVLGWIF
ncbi:MAG: hypothetical protein OXD36_02290 [Rhodobacter sp.]|nr:hypothetical protein [Rhodobacter sp.]